MASPMRFPPDWLEAGSGGVASDLDLAVLLVNSYDSLADPPDRLRDLDWLKAVLDDVGHGVLAAELTAGDLEPLRDLRAGLRSVFEATDLVAAADAVNRLLSEADAVLLLVPGPFPGSPSTHPARLEAGVGRHGLAGLQARLPVAVAHHVARFGTTRLGTCASDPCHCAFIDRTRGGTKRYCCTWCNDRAAARAYRKRQNTGQKT